MADRLNNTREDIDDDDQDLGVDDDRDGDTGGDDTGGDGDTGDGDDGDDDGQSDTVEVLQLRLTKADRALGKANREAEKLRRELQALKKKPRGGARRDRAGSDRAGSRSRTRDRRSASDRRPARRRDDDRGDDDRGVINDRYDGSRYDDDDRDRDRDDRYVNSRYANSRYDDRYDDDRYDDRDRDDRGSQGVKDRRETERWRNRTLRAEARTALAAAGASARKLGRLVNLIDLDKLEAEENTDGDVVVDGLDEQIVDLKRDFPELFSRRGSGAGRLPAPGGPRDGSGARKPKTATEIAVDQLLGGRPGSRRR